MTRNEGTIDRAIRVTVGALLIIGAATGTIGIWGYIGIVPVITGALGYCPAYSLIGLNTCPMNKRG
ncbi:YgaP family membrane protein [Acidiphilium sp.]|uniref:YgaP family membrane protein n=1 Tax=Acidiphilium sp. TaxID=527 RepID=UPI003D06C815